MGFFDKKIVFLSVKPPILLGKHYCSEGFGYKEMTFSFKVCCSVQISLGNNVQPPLALHKIVLKKKCFSL